MDEHVLPETIPNLLSARSLPGQPYGDWMVPFRNIGALLVERAERTPDKEWLAYYDEAGIAARYTYGEFADRARRVASLMAGPLGPGAGDRLATMMANDARTVLVYFGAWLIGATVVPVNCSEDDDRVAYILSNSEAKALVVQADQLDRCDAILPNVSGVEECVQVGGAPRSGYLDFEAEVN